MRKVILISLVIFFAVLAGGYCISWFSQAAQIKRGIEQAIVNINQQQKYLTYDSIETSGFPLDVNISIIKPHFSGRIDPLLKTHSQPDTTTSTPEWNEDILLNGRITLGINALSDHYSLRVSGNWQRNSTIGGQTISIVAQSAGDSVCMLQMARSGGILNALWDYHAMVRDNGKDFFKDLRMFDCIGMANTIYDATSHEKLVNNGPWRFYVSNEPQGTQQQIRFYLKVADLEVTPQGDAMMMLQRTALPQSFYPVKYSLLGKQSMEIDFSYTGPTDWQTAGKNPPLDIVLSKFDINNQMYTSNATFFLSNGMKDANRVARLVYKIESNINEQYDVFLQDMLHGFVQQLYSGKGQQIPAFQPYLQKYTAEELYSIIYPIIPHLHSLGKLVQALDVSYQGDVDFNAGDVTLSNMEFSASPYGIKGNGTAKRIAGNPLPEGHAVLTCSNCTQLVDDVTGYAMRLQKTMSYFQTPEQLAAATPIDPKFIDGIKGFLKALAEPTQGGDYVYTIISDKTAGVTVSGKSINDVLAMYNEYIGSVLKAHSDANGVPAATTAPVPATAPAPAPAAIPTPMVPAR